MITHGGRLLFEADLARPRRRPSEPGLEFWQVCDYLQHAAWPGNPPQVRDRLIIARKAQAELSAARVSEADISVHHARTGESEIELLRAEIESAKSSINYLLEFVPSRARSLSAKQRQVVVSGLTAAARDLTIPVSSTTFEWVEVSDSDTSSCHQLQMKIFADGPLTPDAAAAAELALHGALFDLLDPEDRLGFQLIADIEHG